MALLLRLKSTRTKNHSLTNSPPLHHLFSTSNPTGNNGADDNNNNKPTFADSLRDLRQSLKTQPTSNTRSSTLSSSNSQQNQSVRDIMSKIQTFRNKTAAPVSNDSSSPQQISFSEMYNKLPNQNQSGPKTGSETTKDPFDMVRVSLNQLRDPNQAKTPRLKLNQPVFGGNGRFPESIFGNEMKERIDRSSNLKNFGSVRLYMHNELGEKLKNLRPQGKGKEGFSIAELSERLKKVRENDEEEAKSNNNAPNNILMHLHNAAANIEAKDSKTPNKTSLQRVNFLSMMNGTPTYLTKPPKEHLVEKYFHPDNMSSAEKLKIELAKVRDEFKMSESDCGSARVQVATLTTKIKHLSSVLHKKDVHSRKGLIAMVQKRKKLLKYLRRTDWDSYCFVISKLGLRDNPEHTYKARTGKSGDVAS